MEIKQLAFHFAHGIIEGMLYEEIENLSKDAASRAYRSCRYYWLSERFDVEIQFTKEFDADKAADAFYETHPNQRWTYLGPIIYGVDEHPAGAGGLNDSAWNPDGDEFRKCLLTEAKVAAITLAKRIV